MIDQMGALALAKGAPLPVNWPLPELVVPAAELDVWRARNGLASASRPVVTLSPGAVGAGKAWPPEHYAALAKPRTQAGAAVWVLGGPAERPIARRIAEAAGPLARDLTGADLRTAVLALAAANASVTNDSGLMHVSAALDTPTVAIFGPTSPWHWRPLNPVSAILEPENEPEARRRARTRGNDAVAHHRTADVSVERVLAATRAALAEPR